MFGIKSQLQFLDCRLYVDFGEGFNEKDTINNSVQIQPEGKFVVTFYIKSDRAIKKLRFDPAEKTALAFTINKISVNGETIEEFTSNAIQIIDEYHYFVTADPFFVINRKFPMGETFVEIVGAFKRDIPPDIQNMKKIPVPSKFNKIRDIKNKFFN